MSSWKGTQLKWGTDGEWERRLGRERGGGGQITSNLGPDWTGVAPHAKEGFQVSKRDSGTVEGLPGKGGIIEGNYQGDSSRGLCHVLSYIVNPVYIVLLCVCG
jgi:hypothetical protein